MTDTLNQQQIPPQEVQQEQVEQQQQVQQKQPDNAEAPSSSAQEQPQEGVKSDLFFNIKQDETQDLQAGIEYLATYIVSESAGKFREVTVTVSLAGIKVSEPANKKRTRDFEIDQILQYSYNRSQNRFTFAYLEADGVLANYRFISRDFFDIHQTLGSAIAQMVKSKGLTNEIPSGEQQPGEMIGRPASSYNDSVMADALAEQLQTAAIAESAKANTIPEVAEAKVDVAPVAMSEEWQQQNTSSSHQSQEEPPMVIYSKDDDAQSVMTVDNEEQDQFADSVADPSKPASPSKKKQNKEFGKTIRGWSLFNAPNGAPGRKSPAELGSITEGEQLANQGGIGQSKRLSVGLNPNTKRKSSVDIFGMGQKSPMVGHEGASSAASIDSASIQNREQPAVERKFDAYGREVLIKNLKNGKYDITAGTAEALVNSLAEEAPPDTIYIEVFLLTFRHFMTPVDLIKLLRQRFHYQGDGPSNSAIVRVRVVSVLKKWAEKHYYDFRFPEMITAFEEFLVDINSSDCSKYGPQLKSIVDSELERAKTFKEAVKPIPPPEVAKVLKNSDFLTMWSPKRVAQELTLADLKLFRQIKPEEFCIFLWGEKKDPRIANFNSYIDRFNTTGFWVSTVIVAQKDIKKRAEIIDKFIQVMKYLHKFSNYGTLMAVISGLNTTAVSRLKKTWEIVNKGRQIATYKELEAKMSYRGNFKAYREIEATSKTPFIPFFGLYVKDLTFMNDGNQKHVAAKPQAEVPKSSNASTNDAGAEDPASHSLSLSGHMKNAEGASLSSLQTKGSEEATGKVVSINDETVPPPEMAKMINFEKCKSISDKIHAIRVFQQSSYKFEDEKEKDDGGFFHTYGGSDAELIVYLAHPFGPPAVEDEKLLLEMSKECEVSERGGYVARPPSVTNEVK